MPHSVVTNSIKFAKLPFLLTEMPKTVFLLKNSRTNINKDPKLGRAYAYGLTKHL